MKKGLTELVFILDKSGSMSGLERDTIGGFNSMIKKQKKEKGEANVTTALFSNGTEFIHDRVDIKEVKNLTDRQYFVGGCTALLDSIGICIDKMVNVQRRLPEKERAEKVIFVIITDGYENASCEYTYDKIKKMITIEQERYDWEFLFLGANIDAVAEGARFGIREDRAVQYKGDGYGTALNYSVVADAVADIRVFGSAGRVDGSWKDRIEKDVKKRGK